MLPVEDVECDVLAGTSGIRQKASDSFQIHFSVFLISI